jgi:hypothetical protein
MEKEDTLPNSFSKVITENKTRKDITGKEIIIVHENR